MSDDVIRLSGVKRGIKMAGFSKKKQALPYIVKICPLLFPSAYPRFFEAENQGIPDTILPSQEDGSFDLNTLSQVVLEPTSFSHILQ